MTVSLVDLSIDRQLTSPQSHFSFMAGVSFLYAFFNLYSMGGGPGVPSLAEAQMDIESCTAVLAYLARELSN